MFLWNGRREKTDDDSGDENDGKQDDAEVQVVDLLDDVGSVVAGLAAGGDAVGVLPDKAGQPHRQADHQAVKRPLHRQQQHTASDGGL